MTLRVAMVGYGFMGAAHSVGWRQAPRVFDLPEDVEMAVLVGRNADAVAQAAAHWGWAESATDWREVVARDDIDLWGESPGLRLPTFSGKLVAGGTHERYCESPPWFPP